MSTPARSFVTLRPPLPFVADRAGAGFVTALAVDHLVLEFPSELRATARDRLTVAFGEGRSFTLRVAFGTAAFAGSSQGLKVEAEVEPEDLRELDNLLTLVRKGQHIAICESMDVEAKDRFTGFSEVILRPSALPELAWDDLRTETRFLGRAFPLPLLITGMTGGLLRGAEINARLAAAAQHFGIPMGVGSQRIALEHPEHASIFAVKREAPKVFLIGNLGIGQLRSPTYLDDCKRAVAMIDADALAIHLNVLQEIVQVEGDRDFRGLTDRIGEVARKLGVPVLVKEVGGGLDPLSAARLLECGVSAVDVGGKGGTSWSYIEGLRAQSAATRAVAETFRDFGLPTALAVSALHRRLPKLELAATGGVRDGLAVAKAVGLGARVAGVGLPIFRAALASEEAPFAVLETLAQGLKTAMLASGARNLESLKARVRPTRRFEEMLSDFTD